MPQGALGSEPALQSTQLEIRGDGGRSPDFTDVASPTSTTSSGGNLRAMDTPGVSFDIVCDIRAPRLRRRAQRSCE